MFLEKTSQCRTLADLTSDLVSLRIILYWLYDSGVLSVLYWRYAFFFSSHVLLISLENHGVLLCFLGCTCLVRIPSASFAASPILFFSFSRLVLTSSPSTIGFISEALLSLSWYKVLVEWSYRDSILSFSSLFLGSLLVFRDSFNLIFPTAVYGRY